MDDATTRQFHGMERGCCTTVAQRRSRTMARHAEERDPKGRHYMSTSDNSARAERCEYDVGIWPVKGDTCVRKFTNCRAWLQLGEESRRQYGHLLLTKLKLMVARNGRSFACRHTEMHDSSKNRPHGCVTYTLVVTSHGAWRWERNIGPPTLLPC